MKRIRAHILSMKTEPGFREVFREIDRDGDGTVDRRELRNALSQIGLKVGDDDARRIILRYDRDGDGRMSYSDFVRFMEKTGKHASHINRVVSRMRGVVKSTEDLFAAFERMDSDGDGQLSRDELRSGLEDLGLELSTRDVNLITDCFDTDGDSYIAFESLWTFWKYRNWCECGERQHSQRIDGLLSRVRAASKRRLFELVSKTTTKIFSGVVQYAR